MPKKTGQLPDPMDTDSLFFGGKPSSGGSQASFGFGTSKNTVTSPFPTAPKTDAEIATALADEIKRYNNTNYQEKEPIYGLVVHVHDPELRLGDEAILVKSDENPEYENMRFKLVEAETNNAPASWESTSTGEIVSASMGWFNEVAKRQRQVTMVNPSLNPYAKVVTDKGLVTVPIGKHFPPVGTIVAIKEDDIVELPVETNFGRNQTNTRYHANTLHYNGFEWTPKRVLAKVNSIQPSQSSVRKNPDAVVEHQDTKKILNNYLDLAISPGDTVETDVSYNIVLGVHVKDKKKQSASVTVNVGWNDVIGMQAAKEAIRNGIIAPFRNADLYKEYKSTKTPKGMLMYGPPGNGKTLLGKAIATELGGKDVYFRYVKSTELLDSYVGESERLVRELFSDAARTFQEEQKRTVIFLDECDAILMNRSNRDGTAKSLVAPFLTEMDGFEESAAFVILATNRPDILDPAVTREGRCDFKVRVDRPDQKTATAILYHYIGKVRLEKDLDALSVATEVVEGIWANRQVLASGTYHGQSVEVLFQHVVSGAMMENIVRIAVGNAVQRDLASRAKDSKAKVSGVNKQDIVKAVQATLHNAAHLSHQDVIAEILGLA